jgi:outer membrane protein assembly factor BamB
MVTLDAHLLAFDRQSGAILWDVVLADYKIGYSATLAPLVVNDKVIVGISGGAYPTRGFLDAYDPETGKRISPCCRSFCQTRCCRSVRVDRGAFFPYRGP